ncbi:MAG: NUDIX domain-containing protein [Patescibacteria group bacterium]
METFKIIRDEDLGQTIAAPVQYRERRASRVIIFDQERNIGLLNVAKKHYHKLPGGGIEEGETIIAALRRETMEELGCQVNNVEDLGMIEEYRGKFGLHRVSYCFIGNVDGEKKPPHLEQGEIDDGFEPVWLGLDQAIEILESESDVSDYEGKFIRMRDLMFLKEARKYLYEKK